MVRFIRSHKARIWINALGTPALKIRAGEADEPERLLRALAKRGLR